MKAPPKHLYDWADEAEGRGNHVFAAKARQMADERLMATFTLVDQLVDQIQLRRSPIAL